MDDNDVILCADASRNGPIFAALCELLHEVCCYDSASDTWFVTCSANGHMDGLDVRDLVFAVGRKHNGLRAKVAKLTEAGDAMGSLLDGLQYDYDVSLRTVDALRDAMQAWQEAKDG